MFGMPVATLELVDKCNALQRSIEGLRRDNEWLSTRLSNTDRTLALLLQYLELKQVDVQAFSQLVKVPKP